MGRIRHWKQRWDPNADFVFLKRMSLGLDPKRPVAMPGDPVPKGEVRLGRGRLKRWWDAGYIGLAGWRDPSDLKREKREEDAAEVREALAAAAERLPGLLAEAEELKAAKEPEEAALAELDRDLASMKALLERAAFLGVGLEDEALAALAGVEASEPEPEAPPAPAPEPVTTESQDPLPGPTVTATADGFEVSLPSGELAEVGSIEEATEFIRTGELPAAPESPSAAPEGGGDADAVSAPEGADAATGAQEGASEAEVVVTPTGGGWFVVAVPGEDEPRKVQGEANLKALLAELGAEE